MASSSSSSPEFLYCPMCDVNYDEATHCPRLLSCGHILCSSCLSKLLTHNGIECPTNQKTMQTTKVESPLKNAALLEVLSSHSASQQVEAEQLNCDVCDDSDCHPALHFCVDCQQYLCEFTLNFHLQMRATSSHKIVSADSVQSHPKSIAKLLCGVQRRMFEFFDVDCQCELCSHCIILDHSGHKCQSIVDAGMEC